MPHKVATFFRSHTTSTFPSALDATVAASKKKNKAAALPSALNRKHAASHDGALSSSSSSIRSTDTSSSMTNNRNSLHLNSHSPRTSSKSVLQHVPAKLAMEMESPPVVLYGQPSTSSGALLSGMLRLTISDENMAIESFGMKLAVEVKMKKPFHAHCPECTTQSTDLTNWKFVPGPTSLKKGVHDYPFSFLFPGHLPATMHGTLAAVDYVFKAHLKPQTGDAITLTRELDVKRSVLPSEVPRQSIRIFPPTNLTAHVELPSVIHPIGQFRASMRVDGIVKRNAENRTQTHWKLKRLTWHIEETQKVISPACAKHAAKAGAGPDEKKGVAHQDTRTLNTVEMKTGWKADYGSGPDGSIEMEFPFSVRADSRPQCDVKAGDGTEVSHALVIEMIIAEEVAPITRPNHSTPTGAARVLRMSFNLVMTERTGMGVSWDEEQPPLYQNVPESPPSYGRAEISDYVGAPIPDYQELESLGD